MKAEIALYNGEGLLGDKLIRWWTHSEFSHVELIINDTWHTSSIRDGGVRKRHSTARPTENWVFVAVDIDTEKAVELFNEIEGMSYDWFGIAFSQFIKADGHEREKWFCSEVVALMMQLEEPQRYSPEDFNRLYNKS